MKNALMAWPYRHIRYFFAGILMAVLCLGLNLNTAVAEQLSLDLNTAATKDASSVANKKVAEDASYLLGAGDVLKITVYNNADLSLETKVSEAGTISYPLIGDVYVVGLTVSAAEKKLAKLLDTGGFVKKPQINILVTLYQSKMISVLGSVLKPGRYPLDRATNLADMLALVGGATADGSDLVTIIGKKGKKEYDLHNIVDKGESAQNIALEGGEIIY